MAVSTGSPRPLTRQYDEVWLSGVQSHLHRVEDLAANADFVARAIFRAPYPLDILSIQILPEAASAGFNISSFQANITNVTAAETIAAYNEMVNWTANVPVNLTLTAANTDIAADAVLALDVTQTSASTNAPAFTVQINYRVRPG